MVDLVRGVAAILAVLVGAVIDAQTGSIVVLVSLTVLIAATVVATRRSVPIVGAPAVQQVFALRSRSAAAIRPSGTAPTVRRRHRARAPGRAA